MSDKEPTNDARQEAEQIQDLQEIREISRRRDVARERNSQLSQEELGERKKLHWMCCPKCGTELSEVEFRQVKVDKCFSCGGVFLDDGELEQLTGKPGWFESMLQFFSGA